MARKNKIIISLFIVFFTVVIGVIITLINTDKQANAKDETFFEPTEVLNLTSGNYYLDGNFKNSYFVVSDESFRLNVGNEEQAFELFKCICGKNENFSKQHTFEQWYKTILDEWISSQQYIIIPISSEKTHIGWNVTYDTDGNIETYYTAYYIDENNFEFNGCIFTRLTGEIQTD